MIRINLLPHREEKRRQRRQHFYLQAGLMVALGAVIGVAGHAHLARQIAHQEGRNALLRDEITLLDREIVEISNLRQRIDALLARKQVIESLQGQRGETVHLFNELVYRMPDGVRLESLRQADRVVTLVGHAQSNARVSHLMRNLEASPYLGGATLVEVRSASVNHRRLSEFTLNIQVQRPGRDQGAGL